MNSANWTQLPYGKSRVNAEKLSLSLSLSRRLSLGSPIIFFVEYSAVLF